MLDVSGGMCTFITVSIAADVKGQSRINYSGSLEAECDAIKINRAKVLAALNSVCPKCECSISPAEIVRIDSERMRCPKCGHTFEAGKSLGAKG